MSISNAMANALSGLSAASRSADVVSSNVANAQTIGYGLRGVELNSQILGRDGAGVNVTAITRSYDPILTQERRFSDAQVASSQAHVDFYNAFSRSIGQVDQFDSITGRTIGLESALVEAAAYPQSQPHLMNVLHEASGLASQIQDASKELSHQRNLAEQGISDSVDFLQNALNQVADLNASIQSAKANGVDANSFIDQRQVVIDQISEIIPVKEVIRDNGSVSLYTPGGAMLIDSQAAKIGFSPVTTLTPHMTIGGLLSGLTINGQSVSLDANRGPIAGGRLAALFDLRDRIIPESQQQLDAVARDLIERFSSASVDPSSASSGMGVFTDFGNAFDPADEVGLASRISINDVINPDAGGDLWKLRDGVGATSENINADSSILSNMIKTLSEPRVVASGGFSSQSFGAAALSAELYSNSETRLFQNENTLAGASARQNVFLSEELAKGVDTDQEVQKLLVIERNYSANAKVIDTVKTLMDQLLGIV